VGFTAVITLIEDVGYLPDVIGYGDTLRGYYTFELGVPDTDPDPHRGYYAFTSMPTSIVVYADSGWVFRTDESNVLVRMTMGDSLQWGGVGPADVYRFYSVNNTGSSAEMNWSLPTTFVVIEFNDRSLSALADDSLPEDIPVLEEWPDSRFVYVGGSAWSFSAEVIATRASLPTAVEGGPPRVHGRLGPNVPNPFNPATTIPYSIDRAAHVTLAIYDVGGRAVTRVVDERLPAGDYEARWDGRDDAGRFVASGVYFYRLTVDGHSFARKAALLK
jgi:hypothetical protein